jgi:pimeloyl-ACP methyl ester carboxylesterase
MIGRMMALALSAAVGAAVLAAPPARAETVAVEGGELWYETCGKGPRAIVLLHDGLLDATGFDAVWTVLCKDFGVVRYDRRGFGRTAAATTPYSPVDDLVALMKAAGLERATLAGVSSGGGVALNYTLDHPETVDRLVLIGAAIDGFAASDHFNKRNLRIAMPMIIGNVGGVISNAAKDPWLIAPGHEAARARMVEILKASPQNIRHQLKSTVRAGTPAAPRMATLKVPTLILVGEHDIPDVHAAAGAAQALIPGARRIVVPDSGHLVQLEQPREAADLIGDFAKTGR